MKWATSNASFRSTTRIASYDAAILPLPAGTLTQLEMFQNPIKIILGRTLGHTPLGIFAGFQVLDSDLFFGFLFLVLHVLLLVRCWVVYGLSVCSSLQE